MIRRLFPLVFAVAALAQGDLSKQLSLCKDLLPEATRCGILFNSGDQRAPGLISMASQESGLTIVQAPVKSIREISSAMRQLVNQFDVDFIVILDDRVIAGPNAIKFVVKQTVKKKKPVFTSSDNALKSGAFGKFARKGGDWILQINGKVQNLFDITIPDGNVRYAVVQE
ncbi:MAG: ABC transporter substrate binding protein [Acidobacteriota bacterium]|nr:ABC transporter substrate binding protein [Acidobacteriota bacterium]